MRIDDDTTGEVRPPHDRPNPIFNPERAVASVFEKAPPADAEPDSALLQRLKRAKASRAA